MSTKQKILTGVFILAIAGGGFSLWPRYGNTVLSLANGAQAETCKANDGSANAVSALAKVVCGQDLTATPEWIEMPGVATAVPGQKLAPTATKAVPSKTPTLPKTATATRVVSKVVHRGTPLPSATPYPATKTPGPPPATATMRSSSGAGIIGTQKTPCRLAKGPDGKMQANCITDFNINETK